MVVTSIVTIIFVLELSCVVAALIECYIYSINPTPKKKDYGEEKIFSRTICKTRKMFEIEKK